MQGISCDRLANVEIHKGPSEGVKKNQGNECPDITIWLPTVDVCVSQQEATLEDGSPPGSCCRQRDSRCGGRGAPKTLVDKWS